MCGILGWVGFDEGDGALGRVRAILPSLAHRGPDDVGYIVHASNPQWAQVVIGHRRLAIIDLSAAGHQPMATLDGRYVIALNGEIYNYLELRRELAALGHRFRSQSDTEVLLAAFAQWGAACLERLIGMYAFVVLDSRAGRLFFARDCFGMKPFYYRSGASHVAFASEIPALLELSGVPRRANARRLYDYLDRGITDYGDETLFAGIRALPAAHYAELSLERPGELRVTRYWRPDLSCKAELSFDEASRRLRDLFVESVALHLRSDVRVGTLLSGGLDSSAIVMAMRRIGGSSVDIHTFSYIGGQGAPTEEAWIDIVNAAAAAVPHKVYLEPHDWTADAEDLVERQNEPFGSLAIYAQNRVFRCAAESGVKVTLDGQGADELFAGYRYHWATQFASWCERGRWVAAYRMLRGISRSRQPADPTVWRVALTGIKEALPRGPRALARRLRRRAPRPWIDPTWCERHGLAGGAGDEPQDGSSSRLRQALWQGLERGSLPPLLRYEDRNAMAYSIESRLPFLTPQLAQFALALPEEYLVGPDGTSKRVLREAMRGIVPDAILNRRDKIGFGVPIRSWPPAIPAVADLLHSAGDIPAVNRRAVEPRLAELRAGRSLSERDSFLVWRLVTLAAWARHFEVRFD